ncbi:193_t:CDS:2, partial [Dentiscutata erythropus]
NTAPHHKEDTKFFPCFNDSYYTPPIKGLNVIIVPDPLVAGKDAKFNVSGKLAYDIVPGTFLEIKFEASSTNQTISTFTQFFNGSYPAANTSFLIEAPNVPVSSNLTRGDKINVMLFVKQIEIN